MKVTKTALCIASAIFATSAMATDSHNFSDPTKTATSVYGDMATGRLEAKFDNIPDAKISGNTTVFNLGVTSEVYNRDGVRAAMMIGYSYLDRLSGKIGNQPDTDINVKNGHRNAYSLGFAAAKDFDHNILSTVYANFNYHWLQADSPFLSEGYDLTLTGKLNTIEVGSGELNFYPSYTYTHPKTKQPNGDNDTFNTYAVRVAYAMDMFSVYAEPKRVDGEFVYGLGAGYNFTSDFVIGARYESFSKSYNDLKLELSEFSLVLDYRF